MTALDDKRIARFVPVGAEIIERTGVHFRVWAPARKKVEVITGNFAVTLEPEESGYFSGFVPGLGADATYKYRLDSGDAYPDPASRFQPEGPHGPSLIVDPKAFQWTDHQWKGLDLKNQIIYELHIGTFTQEGTFASAIRELKYLADTGITVIEVMPVADFSGRFGWGYDGVNWFAPSRLYGTPDDMRRFVDSAHSFGIGVILDVVYNHFGPDGNYTGQFSPDYVTDRHKTDWGQAINFDGKNSGPVRDFVTANAAYWIREFHLDGLRLDATQNIYDDSEDHILAAITRAAKTAAGNKKTIIIAENEPQETKLIRNVEKGGYGMDGLWNDDFHHSAMVAITGRAEAYYTDYRGTPQEFVSAAKHGYLYQGQWYTWQKQRRGTPSRHCPRYAFVTFIQNHDQVANSARGLRVHQLASSGMYRAMTLLTLLGPGTPMLFQGQEFAASAPFLFFADMPEWLVKLVREGRKQFMRQWRSINTEAMVDCLTDPCVEEAFQRCKLDHSERLKNSATYGMHRDAIRLRRTDDVLTSYETIDGAVLSPSAFVLRYFGFEEQDRLIVVNLGVDLHLDAAPEPLLAPPEGQRWRTLISTEDPKYNGSGAPEIDAEDLNWIIPGHSAALLGSVPAKKEKLRNE